MNFKIWMIIDEDDQKIITTVYATKEEAEKLLKALKESRKPEDDNYWNTWTLFERCAA
jgi:uncharacterized protein YfcZ (UPF0381/DUF406 family)